MVFAFFTVPLVAFLCCFFLPSHLLAGWLLLSSHPCLSYLVRFRGVCAGDGRARVCVCVCACPNNLPSPHLFGSPTAHPLKRHPQDHLEPRTPFLFTIAFVRLLPRIPLLFVSTDDSAMCVSDGLGAHHLASPSPPLCSLWIDAQSMSLSPCEYVRVC